MTQKQLEAALNLMRRMPPSSTETSLNGLINLVPQLTDELLQRVDQPLKTELDSSTGKPFILCDYNRDGDSYRSPWSNKYFPALDDGFTPSTRIRNLEVEANNIFDIYRNLYFEGGISSVYFWDLDNNDSSSFAACFLIKKDVDNIRGLNSGSWNSIHVFECNEINSTGQEKKFEYKLTTTVIISMSVTNELLGTVNLSGSMTKQSASVSPVSDIDANSNHIANMGKMIEDIELQIRNAIEGVYIQKTREVINSMRRSGPSQTEAFRESLKDAVTARGKTRTLDSEPIKS